MKLKTTLLILLTLFTTVSFAQAWKVYPYTPSTTPTSQISFPADEGRHASQPLEWWYTSGHFVGGTSGKEYSFMLTYFYYPQSIYDGFRILSITDEATGTFYQVTKAVKYPTMSQTSLDFTADIYNLFTVEGTDSFKNKVDVDTNPIPFEYQITATGSTMSMDIGLVTAKRPLVLDGDGYFYQGLSSHTYYYSQTANTLTGSFSLNGISENITGTAWIDRQYGNFNPFTGENYEWFSLQLDNGTDLNLWNVFTAANTIPDDPKYKIMAAYVDESTQYTISDFEIERLEYFFTPDNLKSYSKKWRLTSASKNIDLTITANHTTSEVNITELGFRFFEGSVSISGTIGGNAVTGVGFAELLHNYENPDITITSPNGDTYNTSSPITWTVNNPDEGRPLLYDLEYSTDNLTFTPIATALTTPSYTWDGSGINNGDTVWFRVKSYSIDNTLNGEVVSSSSSSATLSAGSFGTKEIKLYRNPVENKLTFELENVWNDGTLEITDINGRAILKKETDNSFIQTINTRFLSQGIYFLKIKTNDFQEIIKFVKK